MLMNQTIIDNHTDVFEYPCHADDQDHRDYDGIYSFPADLLYWHKDGFYCEYCIEDKFLISLFRRGRSLEKEIKLAKERGKCYRKLPEPIYFGEEVLTNTASS